ncbi:putative functional resistance protein KR1 [Sesbania bispinosa]|nr:putative functional resistance protein KR1 [Sesbania bispinosa]
MKGRVLMGEYDHNIDEALSQNDWNHVEIKVSSDEWEIFMEIGIHFDEALLEHEWNHVEIKIHSDSPIEVEIGIHVFKEKGSMNDICFTEPCTKSDFNLALLPENDSKRKTADLNLAQLQENDAKRRKLDLNLQPPLEDDV